MRPLIVLLALALSSAHAAERSSKVRRAFMLENPCPANGQVKGPCPGWVADHIIPICAGGRDEPWNLQWQTAEDGKAKDRIEVRECRDAQKTPR